MRDIPAHRREMALEADGVECCVVGGSAEKKIKRRPAS
jgi:hypothetical protein